MPLNFPLDNQEKGSIESAKFAELTARRFKGGLPVLTATPTYTGIEGEFVLVNDGTYYSFYAYIAGGWRQIGTTGLIYTEIDPPDWSNVASILTWTDWDLSSYVPAGTRTVLISIKRDTNDNINVGVRKNGSSVDTSLSYYTGDVNDIKGANAVICSVDINRVIERYTSGGQADVYFTVLGYWS